MGDVLDLTAARLAKTKQRPPTLVELSDSATIYLLGDWEKMAKKNRLNDYFRATVPGMDKVADVTNYMSDLNEVAKIELNIELYPIVYFPGTIERRQHGWVVKFKLGTAEIATPELASEAYARCFCILLYLKLKRDAIAAGLLG